MTEAKRDKAIDFICDLLFVTLDYVDKSEKGKIKQALRLAYEHGRLAAMKEANRIVGLGKGKKE